MEAHHLVNEFRINILKLDTKSVPQNPSSNTCSSSMTDTSSSSLDLREEDYIDRSSGRSIQTITDLQRIATRMSAARCLHECIPIYATVRGSAISSSTFQRFEVYNLSQHSARTSDWVNLDLVIRYWIRSAIVSIKFLFTHEKTLCQQIFQGLGNGTADACFIQTVKAPATRLFDIAEALCCVHPSSEKLFRILNLHRTLSSLLPLTNDLFNSESLQSIRVKPAQILAKLAEVIRRILSDFEKDVLQEKSPVLPTPEIHRLTRYVMGNVCVMCDYNQTLMELIPSKPLTSDETGSVVVDFAEFEGQSPLSLHIIWIIMQLISNLEAKSKLYEGASLEHFFFMINVHFIVQNIDRCSKLREVIGEGYQKKLAHKLRQVKTNYLGITFEKTLKCLRAEGLNGSEIFASKTKKLTIRLKSFNTRFEKVQQDLAKRVVQDSQLGEDLRKSVKEKLVPAYASFLEQFESVPRGSRIHPAQKHIKYSTEDLETSILSFFQGNLNTCRG